MEREARSVSYTHLDVYKRQDQGWTPPYDPGQPMDWDDTISPPGVVVDRNWIEGREIAEPTRWDPAGELIRYLETLFETGENVGYVVKSWQKDEKWLPADKGAYDRTAGDVYKRQRLRRTQRTMKISMISLTAD